MSICLRTFDEGNLKKKYFILADMPSFTRVLVIALNLPKICVEEFYILKLKSM